MGLILFDVKLIVEKKENFIEAALLFTNKTSYKLYLDGMTLCWKNKIERNVFTIINQKNEKAHFTGMMLKRILVPDDFLLLNVGDQFKAEVVLNEAYDLIKGTQYTVQYSAYNPDSYDPKDDTLIKMESNKVEIVY